MRSVSLLIFCGLFALPLLSEELRQQPGTREKAAWQWTLEERLARRFDAKRAAAEDTSARHSVSVRQRLFGGVDGSETPELLMPNELFSSLLGGLEGSDHFRETSRLILQEGIRAFGWDDARFWRELETLCSTYLTLSRKRVDLPAEPNLADESSSVSKEYVEQLDKDVCAARVAALADARRHFGTEAFDRFLYTVVAPTLRVGSDTPGESSAQHLLFLEGGCK